MGLPPGASERDLDHVSIWSGRSLLVIGFALTAQRAQIKLLHAQVGEGRGGGEGGGGGGGMPCTAPLRTLRSICCTHVQYIEARQDVEAVMAQVRAGPCLLPSGGEAWGKGVGRHRHEGGVGAWLVRYHRGVKCGEFTHIDEALVPLSAGHEFP